MSVRVRSVAALGVALLLAAATGAEAEKKSKPPKEKKGARPRSP